MKRITPSLKSDLQRKILKHILTTKNANYRTISTYTGKDRITNLQSLESLVRYHYIDKIRADPNYEKSKLTFIATAKGLWYAIAYLNIDVEDIVMDDKELAAYRDYLKGVTDREGRKEFMINLAKVILQTNTLDNKGRMRTTDRQKNFEYGFIMGLASSIQQDNFDPTTFFNRQTASSLKKILTPSEVTDTSERFAQFNQKIGLVMKEWEVRLESMKHKD